MSGPNTSFQPAIRAAVLAKNLGFGDSQRLATSSDPVLSSDRKGGVNNFAPMG